MKGLRRELAFTGLPHLGPSSERSPVLLQEKADVRPRRTRASLMPASARRVELVKQATHHRSQQYPRDCDDDETRVQRVHACEHLAPRRVQRVDRAHSPRIIDAFRKASVQLSPSNPW